MQYILHNIISFLIDNFYKMGKRNKNTKLHIDNNHLKLKKRAEVSCYIITGKIQVRFDYSWYNTS